MMRKTITINELSHVGKVIIKSHSLQSDGVSMSDFLQDQAYQNILRTKGTCKVLKMAEECLENIEHHKKEVKKKTLVEKPIKKETKEKIDVEQSRKIETAIKPFSLN